MHASTVPPHTCATLLTPSDYSLPAESVNETTGWKRGEKIINWLYHTRGPPGADGRTRPAGLLGLFGRMRPLSDVMAADSVCGNKKTRRNTMGGEKKGGEIIFQRARNEALI